MKRHAGMRIAALILFASIVMPQADADMVKYSTTVRGSFSGDTNITGQLPKFDPSLFLGAELTSAFFEFDMRSQVEFGASGPVGSPDGQATFRHNYLLRIREFGLPLTSGTEDLGPVTVTVNMLNHAIAPNKTGSRDLTNLSALTGTGNINIDGSNTYSLLTATLPPGVTLGVLSSIPNNASVSITYFYNAVPEPGAFTILAIGILGATALRRVTRKRRRNVQVQDSGAEACSASARVADLENGNGAARSSRP